MGEPELCVGCGQSLVGSGQLYISSRGGSLCRPCSDSVSRRSRVGFDRSDRQSWIRGSRSGEKRAGSIFPEP
jgi:hypothetical protein